MKTYQQGSTLIVVLIVLLLITLIGTTAMRESLFNLRLSTSSQISNLLINNNNAALFELIDPNKVSVRLSSQNMFGYFDGENASDELVFCYRASRSLFFTFQDASVIGSTKRGNQGYCRANYFSTGRQAVLSQVYLTQIASSDSNILESLVTGNDIGAKETTVSAKTIAATVISILPSFSDINSAQIETCFQKSAKKTSSSTKDNNVELCFQEHNIPYNMQYSEFKVSMAPEKATS